MLNTASEFDSEKIFDKYSAMTFDCFSFFNELDLLEIRLNVLDKVADRFVLVESPFTHTGLPKPLYFAENRERFSKFNDRIIHVVVDDFPAMPTAMPSREKAWTRENWQRNAIVKGLPADIRDDDVLLISDLDEIPDPVFVLKALAHPIGITRLDLKSYCFFINMRNISCPIWDNGTRVLTWGTFRNPETYAHATYSDYCLENVNQGPTATRVRFLKPTRIMKPAGWHFTYLGGIEAVQRKMKSIAHTEFDTEDRASMEFIGYKLARGEDLFGNGERLSPEWLDESFPYYVTSNQERFRSFLYPVPTRSKKIQYMALLFRAKFCFRKWVSSTIIALTPKVLVPLRHRLYCRLTGRRRYDAP